MTFGEGWHNNHHGSRTIIPYGLAWYEVDLNWYAIVVLCVFGLVLDIKAYDLLEFLALGIAGKLSLACVTSDSSVKRSTERYKLGATYR